MGQNLFLLLCVFELLVGTSYVSGASGTTSWAKAWKLNLSGCSLDPSELVDPCKERAWLVAAAAAVIAFIGGSLVQVFGTVLFLFGLVKLSPTLVAAVSAAYYGWKRNNKIVLVVGAFLSYLLAFGVQL